MVVEFPRTATTLQFAANAEALAPVDLSPGRPVRITSSHEESVVASTQPDGRLTLTNGRTVTADELWPIELEGALLERLVSVISTMSTTL